MTAAGCADVAFVAVPTFFFGGTFDTATFTVFVAVRSSIVATAFAVTGTARFPGFAGAAGFPGVATFAVAT